MNNLKKIIFITALGFNQLGFVQLHSLDNEVSEGDNEKFVIEEEGDSEGGFCGVQEEGDVIEARSECQPETYGYYYDYDPAERDIDATWPSKKMTSFMEELTK